MRHRLAPAALAAGLAAGLAAVPAPAQLPCGGCPAPAGVQHPAAGPGWLPLGGGGQPRPPVAGSAGPILPDDNALSRLNLRTEWAAAVPLEGGRDAVVLVQVADENQIFVQTRAGLLVAIDSATGARQWTFRYPAGFVNLYPAGWNDDFVFVVNIARLYAFHRYTGVQAFDFETPGAATTGPAADRELVYVVLDGTKVVAYRFPQLLVAGGRSTTAQGARLAVNPADTLAGRTARTTAYSARRDDEFEQSRVAFTRTTDPGSATGQATPSLSALPSITPPYTLDNRGLYGTPSLAVVPSMRQPYTFRPDYLRANQRTPSLTVLPPSVARAYELANLAPRGIEPERVWVHSSGRRYAGPPLVTDRDTATDRAESGNLIRRLWLTTDGRDIEAVDRRTGTTQVLAGLQDRTATPLGGVVVAGPGRELGFVGLTDGNVVALDLLRGGPAGPRTEWRATVGGLMDRPPVLAMDAVFAAGSQSGIAKIDMASGEVVWRTDPTTDRVVGVTGEFVYGRDRNGDLLAFDRRAPTDPGSRRAAPLGRLPVVGFTVPVVNTKTDRLYLAAESGTLVCLRDQAPQYAKTNRLIPPTPKVAAKKDDMNPAAPAPAPAADKKDAAPAENKDAPADKKE